MFMHFLRLLAAGRFPVPMAQMGSYRAMTKPFQLRTPGGKGFLPVAFPITVLCTRPLTDNGSPQQNIGWIPDSRPGQDFRRVWHWFHDNIPRSLWPMIT